MKNSIRTRGMPVDQREFSRDASRSSTPCYRGLPTETGHSAFGSPRALDGESLFLTESSKQLREIIEVRVKYGEILRRAQSRSTMGSTEGERQGPN